MGTSSNLSVVPYAHGTVKGKKHYVVGFLFDYRRELVTLIEKTKPDWQRGKLNGVGGKVEIGEAAYDAMVREFWEETGTSVEDWQHFGVLSGQHSYIDVYRSFSMDPIGYLYSDTERYDQGIIYPTTTTEEEVRVHAVKDLQKLPTIPNLQWLIPMALSIDKYHCREFVIDERIAA